MEIIRRCSLYALSCVVLFTGLSGLFSDKAFAASSADSVLSLYSGSTPFEINSYGGSCPSITTTDGQLDLNTESWWHTIWQYTADYPSGMSSQIQAFWDLYHNNLSVGSGWAFSRDSSNLMTVTVWSNPSTATISLDSSGLHISGGTAYTLKLWLHDGHSCAPFVDSSAIGNYLPVSGLILFVGDIQYPDGYAGAFPPESLDDHRPVISPQFTYQLSDKKLTATDHNQDLPSFTPDPGYNIVKYQVEWTTFKCGSYDTSHGVNAGSCQSPSLKDHQILDQSSDYIYTVDDYAHYQLTAEYLVQECYRYPSYPATPDYCFDISLGTELPDYRFISTSHDFDINGQSLSGDTASETCDASGFCQVTEEDCTIQPDVFATMRCNFNNALNTGLLNPSLNAFKSLISSLVVPSSPSCGFTLSNVNVPGGGMFSFASFGATVCTDAARFRSAFPIGPLVVNFLLALLELRLVVGMVNKMLNDKDNDVIVGVHQ